MIKEVIENYEVHAVIFCFEMTNTRLTQCFIQAMESYSLVGLDWNKTIFALTFADLAHLTHTGSTDITTHFNGSVEWLRGSIVRVLNREMTCCPTAYDPEWVLPSGHKWWLLLWRSILELSPVQL